MAYRFINPTKGIYKSRGNFTRKLYEMFTSISVKMNCLNGLKVHLFNDKLHETRPTFWLKVKCNELIKAGRIPF